MTPEQIYKEINEIENALAQVSDISSMMKAQAEERLKELRDLLSEQKNSLPLLKDKDIV